MTAGRTAIAAPLPTRVSGSRSTGWWGMLTFIVTDTAMFVAFLVSYYYLRSGAPRWPLGQIKQPDLAIAVIGTIVLVGSSVPMIAADIGARRGSRPLVAGGLALAFLLAVAFAVLELWEWSRQSFTLDTNAYASLYFTITGFHLLHVGSALLMNAATQVRIWTRPFGGDRRLWLQNVSLFWHFVDVIWIFIFITLYLSPYFLAS